MTYKSKSLGSAGLAALAGFFFMTALPAPAQEQGQTAVPESQTGPGSQTPAQATPGNPGAPADQASPSYQNRSGSMQGSSHMNNSGMTTKASATGETLSRVKHAKTTLASAQVQDSTGQQIGQVSDVHTSRSGHPTKIDITLSSTNGMRAKTVSVSASRLRYDKNNNTLITTMRATDLQSMPAATSSSM